MPVHHLFMLMQFVLLKHTHPPSDTHIPAIILTAEKLQQLLQALF